MYIENDRQNIDCKDSGTSVCTPMQSTLHKIIIDIMTGNYNQISASICVYFRDLLKKNHEVYRRQ